MLYYIASYVYELFECTCLYTYLYILQISCDSCDKWIHQKCYQICSKYHAQSDIYVATPAKNFII